MISENGKQYKIKPSEMIWDNDKDAKLKVLYHKKTQWSHIAALFHCSESTIQRRLKVLNVLPGKWTTLQDNYLREHYISKTNQEMANSIDINVVYVADRIAFLGLLRKQGRPKKQVNVK